MKFGNVLTENNLFLAPLAGVTDLPFRLLCKEQGCGIVITEMVSAKGILFENKNTVALLQTCPEEKPTGLQLFGSDPHIISNAIKMIEHIPFDFIDINMGCPVPKIFNNGEGSALLKEPKRMEQIILSAKKATNKAITAKIRIGIDENNINAVEAAKALETGGADMIAVHGRHRAQYYSGIADLNIIADVKKAVSIPVVGNGDVTSPASYLNMMEKTGCDGVMIGRAAMGNPWIFKQILDYLKTGEIFEPTINQKIETAIRHSKMTVEQKGEHLGVLEMRKHFAWYTKGMPNSAQIRRKVNEAGTLQQLIDSISEIPVI